MDLKKAILEPRPLKPRILIWADATFKDTDDINKATETEELEKVLSSVFRIDATDQKQRVLLEMYMNVVLFCRRKQFNRAQTSTLLSIFKRVHEANTDTPLNNADQCFNYCSELLLCHSVRRPPFSIALYDLNQMTDILKYFTDTYMRHYALYKYIFTPQMFLDLSLTYTGPSGDIEDIQESPADDNLERKNETTGESPEENEAGTDDKSTAGTNSTQPTDDKQHNGTSTEPVPDRSGSTKKVELQTMVQQEVKRELQRLSGQLEQRLKESTEQLNTILSSLEINHQPKK